MNPSDTAASGGKSASDDQSRMYPRVTSFRFRGSVSPTQEATWERLWPRLGRDVCDEQIDPQAWFGRSAPLVLEIGSGTGTATAAMAQAEPEVNLMAVEVYRPGLAKLLQAVDREGIENIRLIRGDAVDVLRNMIAPDSLTGVRVFFPDPWPKVRHHKRRLLQSGTFSLIASRLRPGGVLHVATDHADYAEAIAETGDAEPALRRLDWDAPMSLERPTTKFEGKAADVGRTINEFLWGRADTE